MKKNFFSPLLFVAVFGSGIRDPGSGMGKNQDPGSGINIPDPPHCLLYHSLYCIFCCLCRFCGRAKRNPHCGQGSSLSRWWTWRRWRVRTARLANRRGHWSQAWGRGFSCLNFMWLRKFRGTLVYSLVWMRLPIRWIRIRSYVIVFGGSGSKLTDVINCKTRQIYVKNCEGGWDLA